MIREGWEKLGFFQILDPHFQSEAARLVMTKELNIDEEYKEPTRRKRGSKSITTSRSTTAVAASQPHLPAVTDELEEPDGTGNDYDVDNHDIDHVSDSESDEELDDPNTESEAQINNVDPGEVDQDIVTALAACIDSCDTTPNCHTGRRTSARLSQTAQRRGDNRMAQLVQEDTFDEACFELE